MVCGVVIALGGAATAAEPDDQRPWKLTATALGYVVPDQPDFVMVLVPVDIRRSMSRGGTTTRRCAAAPRSPVGTRPGASA
jgi:hypothetical protein